LLEPV